MDSEERIHGERGVDDISACTRDAAGVGAVAAERVAAARVWGTAWNRAERAALVATGLPGGGRGSAGGGVHRRARAGKLAAAPLRPSPRSIGFESDSYSRAGALYLRGTTKFSVEIGNRYVPDGSRWARCLSGTKRSYTRHREPDTEDRDEDL
jgi:hypothetical protein